MLVTQSRGRTLLGLALLAAVGLLALQWSRQSLVTVHHYAVRCRTTSVGNAGCAWEAVTLWKRPDDLLACVDLPPAFVPEVSVVRAWLMGPAWVQSATTVHLPGTSTVCVTAVSATNRLNAWVGKPASGSDAVSGPTQAIFYLEYYNATAALLDPETDVTKRQPLKVKTPIAFVGTVLQTAIGATEADRAEARKLAAEAGGGADLDCRAFRSSEAFQAHNNCSSLFGQELALCPGASASDPTSAMDMLRLPVDEWRVRGLAWSETAGLADISAPWANHKMVLLGDSTLRKLAAVWTASLAVHEEMIPCTCGTRPMLQPYPDGVAHIPLKGLQESLDGSLRALKFASESASPGDVLVVGSGLWDAAYGDLTVYSTRVRDLLVAAAASKFSRVVWLTTTAIHPGRRKMNEHAMNSVLTWHNYFTTVRVDAVNEIALSHLRRLERTNRIQTGRIEVVDVTHITRAAPWLTMPGDMVHYCPTLLVEIQYLVQRQLALGSPNGGGGRLGFAED